LAAPHSSKRFSECKPAVSEIAGHIYLTLVRLSLAGRRTGVDAAFRVFHAEIRRKYQENLILRLI
jgi:hypothetical protein